MSEVSTSLYKYFILCVCFTSYFVLSIAVLPHSLGIVFHHLLLSLDIHHPLMLDPKSACISIFPISTIPPQLRENTKGYYLLHILQM